MQSLALWVSMLDLHVHGFARKYESHVSLGKLKSVMVPYCLRISLEINDLFLVNCLFNIVIKMVLYIVGWLLPSSSFCCSFFFTCILFNLHIMRDCYYFGNVVHWLQNLKK